MKPSARIYRSRLILRCSVSYIALMDGSNAATLALRQAPWFGRRGAEVA